MNSRIHTQDQHTKKETQDLSTTPVQGMFKTRPFVVQAQRANQVKQPDLKTSLVQAKHYGHRLNQFDASVSKPEALQPKMEMGKPVQLAPIRKRRTQAVSQSPSHRIFALRGRKVHSFKVQRSHLGTGTNTNKATRSHVNNPAQVTSPQQVQSSYSVGKKNSRTEFENLPPSRGNWDAGHLLGKQSGGLGNDTNTVFPQNPAINRGNTLDKGKPNEMKTRPLWREHEDKFNQDLKNSPAETVGHYSVTLHDQSRPDYNNMLSTKHRRKR